uniref:Secreted protein n=1 Tax=Brassica oleracea TaxID=3712 RepID=A0A3P6E0Q2_BRAOL|nr:unnamed protein product [Brassica oleracea]
MNIIEAAFFLCFISSSNVHFAGATKQNRRQHHAVREPIHTQSLTDTLLEQTHQRRLTTTFFFPLQGVPINDRRLHALRHTRITPRARHSPL